jgi:hypothetical protein
MMRGASRAEIAAWGISSLVQRFRLIVDTARPSRVVIECRRCDAAWELRVPASEAVRPHGSGVGAGNILHLLNHAGSHEPCPKNSDIEQRACRTCCSEEGHA